MPIPGSILSKRVIASQSKSMYPDRCTIILSTTIQEGSGAPIPGTFTDVSGLQNIPCRIGPVILMRPTDSEERSAVSTRWLENRQLSLDGYYPAIDPTVHEAVITCPRTGDTETFIIFGVEHDGDRVNSRLRLQIVRQ